MKRLFLLMIVAALVLLAATQVSAESHRLSLHADYNVPVSTNSVGSNVEFGAQYRFWGIFQFNGSVFTNFNYGADNIFNIASITPAGLFSAGFGMKVPLGGFALEFGWSQFYTGFGDNAGVYHFSDSYSIGLAIDLSDSFGIRVFNRSLYNFTTQAAASQHFAVTVAQGRVNTLGGGVVLHLF
ncbi:MAG TPA: hypothetical protein VMW69_02290 [Spirochaetia bacterium]|nr:hypothetical protein [Spirochaetia bacterium]